MSITREIVSKRAAEALLAVFVVVIFNWIGYPFQIRFQYAPVNYWVFAGLVLSIPILAFISFAIAGEYRDRVTGVITAVALALPCGVVGYFAIDNGNRSAILGSDPSYEVIDELKIDSTNYRLYRTNGGATTAFGIDLRREYDLFFGIKIVKKIFTAQEVEIATLTHLDENTLRINVGPYFSSNDSRVFDVEL